MNPPALPDAVAAFIERDIHSVLQLEILLLLRERVGEWTPEEVAVELRITVQAAQLHLRDLAGRGLASGSAPTRSYVYAPAPELRLLVDQLAACYETMRYTVINQIFSESRDSARTLAEAFRIRRKRND